MKIIKLFCSMALPVLFGYQVALGCRCYTIPPPCYEYPKYDAVFVGTVKKVEEGKEPFNFIPKVEIKVEHDFKGNMSETVFTHNEPHSCAWSFGKNQKFLFYGQFNDKNKEFFGTGLCTRTQVFDENLADFDFLKSIKSANLSYLIWGTVTDGSKYSMVEGVKAVVIGNKRKLTGISDKNGDLKIKVPKEGKYKVRLFIPKGADFNISQNDEQIRIFKRFGIHNKQRFLEYEVEVKNNQCGWFDSVIYKNRKQ